MKVQLKKITLTNFKGIRSQQFDFNDATTIIGGANGTGKTTIFDAFIWCLFGKDCQDHKQFSIKTLNPDGTPINRLPHEVEIELLADKQPIRLKRTYTEKWQKKRGAVEEEFTGHEEGRFYNDVPLSVAEYAEKINAICKEDVFKMVTNPHYFLSQKDEVIRAMLFRMAGDVTAQDIIKDHPELSELLDKLQGKSIEEYRREVLAQCKRLKDELKAVPIRMEEVQRNMPEEKDTKALQKQHDHLKKEIEKTEACMEDKSKAFQESNKQNLTHLKAIADAENELQSYEFEQRMKAQNEYREQCHKQKELKSQYEYNKKCIEQLEDEKAKLLVLQHECDDKRNELLAEFQAIKENELVFDDNMFVCPTCKRPFDTDDIEARKQEMTEHFNEEKANHLKQINIDGQANNERKFKICKQVDEKDDLIDQYQNKLQEIQAEPLYSADLSQAPTDDTYKTTQEFAVLYQKVQDLKQQKQQQSTMPDLSEFKAKKAELTAELENVQNDIILVSTRNTQLARLEELKQQQQTLNEQLAQYEREDYHVQQYQKIRANMVTTKINNLFTCVWFKLYDTQINGGEVECCKAMINGVPYSDANNAAKINAGLDIINAICKYEDITAPIFIDNAESVNNILPTASQQIRLVVTTDKLLVLKK